MSLGLANSSRSKNQKKIIKLVLSILIFLSAINVNSTDRKKILYLNSYHIGYNWADEITQEIRNIFNSSNNIDVYIEHMDTKRNSDVTYFSRLYNVYNHKYKKIDFDLTICSDNNALDFALKYKDTKLISSPIVFCGISNPEDYDFNDDVYGVVEEISYDLQIDIILKTMPSVEHIYLVLEKTVTGNLYKKYFNEIKDKINQNVSIHFIDNINVNCLPDIISNIQPNSAIYYFAVSVDMYGNPVNSDEILKIIVNNSKVPVYCDPSSKEVSGIIGGIRSSGYEQGKEASKIAIQLLNDETRKHVPKLTKPEAKYIFDIEAIEAFNLNINNFPKDAIYINKPVSIFVKYRNKLILAGCILLVLLTIIVILTRNIILRIRFEKELMIANEKAVESDKLKSAFLANVSHEIRTPLNTILGFADILSKNNSLVHKDRSLFSHITNASYALTNLISDILEISKIEAGQVTINYENSNVVPLMAQQYYLYKEDARKHNNLLIFDNKESQPINIIIDPQRFEQIFSYLIKNAIKFTENGKINFGYKYIDDQLVFYVYDTGIGINPEKAEYIFGNFNKIENHKEKLYRGAGLGLAITKNIIQLMNGHIWFESNEREGSRFYFSFNGKY